MALYPVPSERGWVVHGHMAVRALVSLLPGVSSEVGIIVAALPSLEFATRKHALESSMGLNEQL